MDAQPSGKRKTWCHYVILARALDGIWPVGHACAVLCWGTAAAGASAQHCTGMTNWRNTIQCLGEDDIMSLGIKSSAFLRVEDLFSWKFEVQINSCWRMKFMKITEFDLKWVHMARYAFILRQVRAIWLRIISKLLPTPTMGVKDQTNQK